VHDYAIKNDRGMSIKVLDYGGTITEINVPDRSGTIKNVVLKLANLAAYENRQNFSAIIGRFANRINGGGFTLDGKFYALKSSPSGISSHGGVDGFATKVWQAHPFTDRKQCGVEMTYVSPDGENGFPGELKTVVTFALDNHNQLTIRYIATTTKPTVVNLTHHMFLNLAGGGTAANHLIQFKASHYLPMNALKIVTGDIAPVAGTAFDLRRPKAIADGIVADDAQIRLGNGYDHTFVFDKPSKKGAIVAQLSSPESGITLAIVTSEPGAQFYSGNSFDGRLIDANGRPVLKSFGVALETQHFPNSPNVASFPTTVLRPGKVFTSYTQYQFNTEGSQ
jgi:aldose 1-epimerase